MRHAHHSAGTRVTLINESWFASMLLYTLAQVVTSSPSLACVHGIHFTAGLQVADASTAERWHSRRIASIMGYKSARERRA